jgi:hypothetical protein
MLGVFAQFRRCSFPSGEFLRTPKTCNAKYSALTSLIMQSLHGQRGVCLHESKIRRSPLWGCKGREGNRLHLDCATKCVREPKYSVLTASPSKGLNGIGHLEAGSRADCKTSVSTSC